MKLIAETKKSLRLERKGRFEGNTEEGLAGVGPSGHLKEE